MVRVLQVVTVLLVAMAMSFAVAHAAEFPGKRRLPRDTYLAVQRIYHPGFTVGGVSEPLSIVALIALLLFTPRDTTSFWWICAALAAVIGMQAVYWLAIHPVNRFWLKGERLPAASARFFAVGNRGMVGEHDTGDWISLRDRWEYSHVVRAALAAPALVFVAIAVTGAPAGR